MCDLHGAGHPAVLVRPDSDEVGAVGDDEIDVLLQQTDVLGLEDGCLYHLSQLAVSEL